MTFFVDPAIAEESELDSVDTITLSYTFYPAPDAAIAGKAGRRRGAASTRRHPVTGDAAMIPWGA